MYQSGIALRFYCDTFAGAINPEDPLAEFHRDCSDAVVDEAASYRTPFQDADSRKAEEMFDAIIAARISKQKERQ